MVLFWVGLSVWALIGIILESEDFLDKIKDCRNCRKGRRILAGLLTLFQFPLAAVSGPVLFIVKLSVLMDDENRRIEGGIEGRWAY